MRLRKVRLLRLYGEKSEDMCFEEKGEATLTRNAPTCQTNYSYNKFRLIRANSPIRKIPQIPHLRIVFEKALLERNLTTIPTGNMSFHA